MHHDSQLTYCFNRWPFYIMQVTHSPTSLKKGNFRKNVNPFPFLEIIMSANPRRNPELSRIQVWADRGAHHALACNCSCLCELGINKILSVMDTHTLFRLRLARRDYPSPNCVFIFREHLQFCFL